MIIDKKAANALSYFFSKEAKKIFELIIQIFY